MDPTFLAWGALIAGIVVLLLVDLFVLHRGTGEVSIRNATWSTIGFVAISLGFGVALGVMEGARQAEEFFAGYILEWSLSLDNVFVWALIFSAFAVPAAYQHRVLFYGIFGALILRGSFVAAGSELLRRFEWVVYVFGALLLWSGVRMLRGGHAIDPENSRVVKLLRRRVPTTRHIVGAHLFVRAGDIPEQDRPARPALLRRWYATPMLAVLVVVEASDVIFAVDSIPAIFGVTREPFIVFAATALALVGLRSLYFVLAGARDKFLYLDTGLAAVLVFIGAKFMLSEVVHIGPAVSLAVIVVVIGTAIGASVRRAARNRVQSL
ncbi:MAG TPA: TerC/Alx family metal homeostasis membrane protein [Solirubrobacteraceae bacterium]|jgi:tellurite resistance protein TerC